MTFDSFWATTVAMLWGLPLVFMLFGAGAFFMVISRALPLRRARHSFAILSGRYDKSSDPGEISHFQALSTALSATIGMGNIAGVAIAITMGGSGAVFWMWVAGALGMATKYFSCTLSCLFRQRDEDGVWQGGPMYYIEIGMGKRFKPLAIMFALSGTIGCLGLFQANQLANLMSNQWSIANEITGLVAMAIVAMIVVGGVGRIGKVSRSVVPLMCAIYVIGSFVVVIDHFDQVPMVLKAIIFGAFDPTAMIGGGAGIAFKEILIVGVKRAVFSNEAGVGTAALAHGAARTSEPVREGLVAMIGPFIDTHLICTLTALVILTSGVAPHEAGVVMTAMAFESSMPGIGASVLALVFTLFALSTMVSYAYYSQKCARYLFGKKRGGHFIYVYLLLLPCGAIWHPTTTINIIDSAFALMVIPNLIACIYLSPKVLGATQEYFRKYSL
ncbi:MAG: AGCS family alanine or glycine:cation symporter [Gammaproteobacteria bacterium]|jgi:AGCS family alanine or glycine:cation symporter